MAMTSKKVNELIINRVASKTVFEQMQSNGQVNDDELYLVEGTTFSGNYNDLTGKPTIPTALSQLSADSTHRLVTDTEKSTWNGKANVGDIPDISGKANKPTISTFTLLASGWNDNTYDLGNAGSNLEIELDASATDEMVEAWSAAKMVGSATSNILTARGEVPGIDITCILRKVVQ